MSEILAQLQSHADPTKAAEMARYHKTAREVLGVSNPVINAAVAAWRDDRPMTAWLEEAEALWRSGVFEARIAAGKLLIKARMKDVDSDAWALIASWVPDFDGWAIADAVANAGERRVMTDLGRLDQIEAWTASAHVFTRRAAFTFTLPLARKPHPAAAEAAGRATVLTWAEALVADPEWFIQKAIGWWLRTLSRHDAEAVRQFLDGPGQDLKAFARREAAKYLR